MNKVLETMKKAFGTVKDKWMALSRKVRIGIIAGVSVLAFSLIVLIIIMSQTGYKVIFSGASDTEAQEILSAIQNDLGVNEVRITSDGDILVPEEKAEDIRVQLSVLGYPKNMDNSIGERAKKSEEFAADLKRRTGLPVVLWDERLTTVAAHRVLDAGSVALGKKMQVVDKLAAVFILQGYLDFLANQKAMETARTVQEGSNKDE